MNETDFRQALGRLGSDESCCTAGQQHDDLHDALDAHGSMNFPTQPAIGFLEKGLRECRADNADHAKTSRALSLLTAQISKDVDLLKQQSLQNAETSDLNVLPKLSTAVARLTGDAETMNAAVAHSTKCSNDVSASILKIQGTIDITNARISQLEVQDNSMGIFMILLNHFVKLVKLETLGQAFIDAVKFTALDQLFGLEEATVSDVVNPTETPQAKGALTTFFTEVLEALLDSTANGNCDIKALGDNLANAKPLGRFVKTTDACWTRLQRINVLNITESMGRLTPCCRSAACLVCAMQNSWFIEINERKVDLLKDGDMEKRENIIVVRISQTKYAIFEMDPSGLLLYLLRE